MTAAPKACDSRSAATAPPSPSRTPLAPGTSSKLVASSSHLILITPVSADGVPRHSVRPAKVVAPIRPAEDPGSHGDSESQPSIVGVSSRRSSPMNSGYTV